MGGVLRSAIDPVRASRALRDGVRERAPTVGTAVALPCAGRFGVVVTDDPAVAVRELRALSG